MNSFCSIGDGSSTLFWWDDWLGYRIADRLAIPDYMRPFLLQKVDDYFFDGAWHFTHDFIDHYPNIALDILKTPLGDREDIRYWNPSPSGDVTSNIVYKEITASRRLKVNWGRWIWARFIPERRSIIAWRVIKGRLPTFDGLMRCGNFSPNICMLCTRAMENIDHIFWHCSVAASAWKIMLEWFDLQNLILCADINSFIVAAMSVDISPQFSNIWRVGVVTLIWALWHERNNCVFDGKRANHQRMMVSVKAAMLEASSNFKMGNCHNSWSDYQRGRRLGVRCAFAAPREVISVTWWPPLVSWVKVNTDGAADGYPGQIGAGGVFRDAYGQVRGCFHKDGGRGHAFEAELLAAITAIDIAFAQGWNNLWLETDSTYIAQLINSKSTRIPWRYANSWRRTLERMESMELRVSHIYREGNRVADLMANLSTPQGWWPFCIPLIANAVAQDNFSPRYYRQA